MVSTTSGAAVAVILATMSGNRKFWRILFSESGF
jgi:hypothetical protein